MWHGYDHWQSLKWYQKQPHIWTIILSVIMWSSFGVYLVNNYSHLKLALICEGVSVLLDAMLTTSSFILCFVHRKDLTTVILKLDQEVRKVFLRTERREMWRNRFNWLFCAEGTILFTICIAGALPIIISLSLGPLIKGELAYVTLLPLNKTPFSGQWWIEYFYQTYVLVTYYMYYNFKEFLKLNLLFQLSVLYKVAADDMQYLCKETNYKMEEEYEKLKEILRTLKNLEE